MRPPCKWVMVAIGVAVVLGIVGLQAIYTTGRGDNDGVRAPATRPDEETDPRSRGRPHAHPYPEHGREARLPRGVIVKDSVKLSVRSDQHFDDYYGSVCKGQGDTDFPVSARKTMPGIPDTYFLVKTDSSSLSFIEFLAVQAIRVHQGENVRIRLYVQDSAFGGVSTGCWWSAALELINEVILVNVPSSVGGVPTSLAAHRSDFIRFKVLCEDGGVYLDFDAIVLKPLDDLLSNYSLCLAQEKSGGPRYNVAVMMASPGNCIICSMWNTMGYSYGHSGGSWAGHSVDLLTHACVSNADFPYMKLWHTDAFYFGNWNSLGVIFEPSTTVLDDSWVLHLWHKVSGGYYNGLTPENIEKGLSVATRALQPPYLAAKAKHVCDL
ncbi:hypothetical protein Pelo_15297 [Pelomyxa schiedti]|nr:hypothetical protein Pelo_15297 [Pelomyxa schiedti]